MPLSAVRSKTPDRAVDAAPDPIPILLVEDEPDHAELVRKTLQLEGLSNPLFWVDRGDLAIAYLSGGPLYQDRRRFPLPGLVLLDLRLPRKSGFEVLEWASGRRELGTIPFVILTSSKEYCDLSRAIQLGATTYLVKPLHGPELTSLIRTVERAVRR